MINTNALQRLRILERALIKLALDGQIVKRFVDRDIPVIEVEPGFIESDGIQEGYHHITQHNCRIIWRDEL